MEILNHYHKTLSVFNSISVEVDFHLKWTPTEEYEAGHTHFSYIYRCDGNRHEWRGKILSLEKDGTPNPLCSMEMQQIFKDESRYEVHSGVFREKDDNQHIYVMAGKKDADERLKGLLDDPEHGGILIGRMFGNNHNSIYDLLKNSKNLKQSATSEKINGIECIVLEGTNPYGHVKAWFAPEKGFTALKWIIRKKGTDRFDDKPLKVQNWVAIFTAKDMQQIDGHYIVTSGFFALEVEQNGELKIDNDNFKLSNVVLNPDFESLEAFKLDVPNGTRVLLTDAPCTCARYEWHNGKAVPIEKM